MKTATAPLHLLLALSLATCLPAATAAGEKASPTATAGSLPAATINSRAAERHQREREARALKALVRQTVTAASDVRAACPGGPRGPRLDLKDPRELPQLGRAYVLHDIRPGVSVSGNLACQPSWNHMFYSAAHALLAANAWAASNPPQAPLLKITPASPDELKRLQRGLANVMAAFDVTAKP